MHRELVATGRPIVYSLCQYGSDTVWEWDSAVGGNLWRTTGDINDNFDRIVVIALTETGLGRYAGPGHWNDPDMLEVGNGKPSHDENQTHMTFWAMLAAPLIAGNNLTQMSDDVRAILTNREVIAIDQDPLGKEANLIFQAGPVQIWSRALDDGTTAHAIFNIGTDRAKLRCSALHLKEAGLLVNTEARDIWSAKNLGRIRDTDSMDIPSHGVILLKLTPK